MAQHVVLPIFEGPLDLLLFLINRAQIDIKEIFVSNITEQYLEYAAQLEYTDMENKSSFLIMAARLLEIKSGKLLPKPIYEKEDEEDEEEKLIRQLQEYKLYKMACEKLKENEEEASKRFYRLPEEVMDRTELDLAGVDVSALKNAFAQILERIEEINTEVPAQEIQRDTFSVQEKIFFIRKRLISNKRTTFKELFDNAASKIEVIVTFLAILELSKHGRVSVTQGTDEEGIIIEATDSTAEEIEIKENE
jgi:segregation and condensation protein A